MRKSKSVASTLLVVLTVLAFLYAVIPRAHAAEGIMGLPPPPPSGIELENGQCPKDFKLYWEPIGGTEVVTYNVQRTLNDTPDTHPLYIYQGPDHGVTFSLTATGYWNLFLNACYGNNCSPWVYAGNVHKRNGDRHEALQNLMDVLGLQSD